ncbi:flagellar filament capping protein FliD [Pseudomonas plecoglossicida]|uniref:flagellar filament capping protein FliD n=1 Tax=Pseudomonas plecoglossicida TaxID=70775 RepID=UPI00049006D4|nr:flagellar filament capping protein FliD [Pseudomonas plecoglossicida]GLR35369.1 hypothetical protein GCM10011247_07660 [Pseudomonas plecoglossicida]
MPIQSIQEQAWDCVKKQVQINKDQVNRQSERCKAEQSAVLELDNALQSFEGVVKGMQGPGKSLLVSTAAFSKDGMASATLGANAQDCSYSLFIGQIARVHQLSLSGLGENVGDSGSLWISQNGAEFEVDLAAVGSEGNGQVSQEALAAAINKHPDNRGVKATLARSQGEVSVVLTSQKTGADSQFTLRSSNAGEQLIASLEGRRILSEGADAVVYLGNENGLRFQQDSNTFKDLVEGVSVTVSKAHEAGETPLMLDICRDKPATKEKVKDFITAINKLLSDVDSLSAPGGEKGRRGVLAGTPIIRAVKYLLGTEVRKSFPDAENKSLLDFGLRATRDGKFSLDDKVLDRMVDSHPQALDKLITGKGQLLDRLSESLAPYTNRTSGSMKAQKDSITTRLKELQHKRTSIEAEQNASYGRKLKQLVATEQALNAMTQTFAMYF